MANVQTLQYKYNKHVAPEALPVWKATQWDGSIDLSKLSKKDKQYIETSGNYVKNADGAWYDRVNFASGNIYDKLDQLERDKKFLEKAEYERQKGILEAAMPKAKTVLEFEVSPLSIIADTFLTSETRIPRNSNSREPVPMTLNKAFKRWIYKVSPDDLALNRETTVTDIVNYVNRERVITARSRTEQEKEANRLEAQRKITARREAAERLLNQFIREQLPIADQKRLAETYNRQYNGTVQVDYTKIPIFLDGISKRFKDDEFTANASQIKGNSWLANQGNGIVAFDVGVGKTVTAIMATVNDIQMGRCKHPLIAVPRTVYENWIFEIKEL